MPVEEMTPVGQEARIARAGRRVVDSAECVRRCAAGGRYAKHPVEEGRVENRAVGPPGAASRERRGRERSHGARCEHHDTERTAREESESRAIGCPEQLPRAL